MAVPTKIDGVIVTNPLDSLHMTVSWNISLELVLGYNIYRSLTKSFVNAVKVNTALVVILQFTDTINQNLRQDFWYFVTAVNLDGESLPSDPAPANVYNAFTLTTHGNIRYIAQEAIRRREKILDFDGEDAVLLVKKVAGVRCSCWDVQYNQGTADDPNCWGTSWVGGYVKIYPARIRVVGIKTLRTRADMGIVLDNKPRVHAGLYPLYHSQDIIVRRNNLRYRVTDINPGIIDGVLTRQTFSIAEITPGDVVYRIPVTFTV